MRAVCAAALSVLNSRTRARTRMAASSVPLSVSPSLLDAHAGVADQLRPLRRVVAHELLQSRRRGCLAAHAEAEEPLVERRVLRDLAARIRQRLDDRWRQAGRRKETEPAARLDRVALLDEGRHL